MSDSPTSGPVSRRAMLTGLGAAAAGAASLSTLAFAPGAAAAGGSQDGDTAQAPSGETSAALTPASLPNTKTFILNTLNFIPISNGAFTYVSPGGVRSTVTDFWNCAIDLPAGSTIQSVSLYINPGGTARGFGIGRYDGATPTFDNFASGTSTAGSAVETATIPNINHVVLGAPWAYRITNLSLTNTAVLYGGVVNYLPAPTGFVPLSPIPRVYNTRDNSLAKLASGEERTISLAPFVPATAQAAVLNLTITQTVDAGYVAVFPANVAWPGNSSINWSTSNQDVGNVVITGIDNAAQVKIRGGVAPTHVIIDVVGYLTL